MAEEKQLPKEYVRFLNRPLWLHLLLSRRSFPADCYSRTHHKKDVISKQYTAKP